MVRRLGSEGGFFNEILLPSFLSLLVFLAALGLAQAKHLVAQRTLLRGDLQSALSAAVATHTTAYLGATRYSIIPPAPARAAFENSLRATLPTNWQNAYVLRRFQVYEPPPPAFLTQPEGTGTAGGTRTATVICSYPSSSPKQIVLNGPGVFAEISVPVKAAEWKGWAFAPEPENMVICAATQAPPYDSQGGGWVGTGAG